MTGRGREVYDWKRAEKREKTGKETGSGKKRPKDVNFQQSDRNDVSERLPFRLLLNQKKTAFARTVTLTCGRRVGEEEVVPAAIGQWEAAAISSSSLHDGYGAAGS
jgi:hypothetical protein